jgi:hypothetical protein
MKLNEVVGSIEVTDNIRDAIDDIASELVVAQLRDSRERMIEYYVNAVGGYNQSIFVVNNPSEDARQIARRIEAYDLILSEYTYGHEPYRFKKVADV